MSTSMANESIATVAAMGIDIGKNSFHLVGLDRGMWPVMDAISASVQPTSASAGHGGPTQVIKGDPDPTDRLQRLSDRTFGGEVIVTTAPSGTSHWRSLHLWRP
jgi:hypothetical protein